MKKSAILVLVAAITIVLCITLIPNVFSQPENVQVLSYNQYISPNYSDYLIVVGEAQNIFAADVVRRDRYRRALQISIVNVRDRERAGYRHRTIVLRII